MLSGRGKYAVVASRSGERGFQVKANTPSVQGAPSISGGFGATGGAIRGFYERSIMEGFLREEDDITFRKIYRDMYTYDTVCGSAVDLIATLPWSEITLSGLKDKKEIETYARSVETLNIKSLLPELTVDYLTYGAVVASLNWNEDIKIFTGVMPQSLDHCVLQMLPMYGRDPIIDLKVPEEVKKLITNKDNRIQNALKDTNLFKGLKGNTLPLDPDTTLYLPRRTMATKQKGTSFLHRCVPFWIMEKALLRGTLELAYRRQKSILHIVAGEEEWEPTNQELTALVNLFIQADIDPTGAIVATRPGVQTNEVRSGSDFWRYDEIYDQVSQAKMRAMGINEALVNGDAQINTMETALSVFIEQLRYMRDNLTRRIFYTRIFPHIAIKNGFISHDKQEVRGSSDEKIKQRMLSIICGSTSMPYWNAGEEAPIDPTTLRMPKLHWHKQLKPEADQEYMNILDNLEQRGLPVPLRVWAAAAGVSIVELMGAYEDDIRLRKAIDKYKKALPAKPEDSFGGGGGFGTPSAPEMPGEDQAQEEASSELLASLISGQRKGRIGILNRKYDNEEFRVRDPANGKVLSRKGRRIFEEKMHKRAAKALANLAKADNRKSVKDQQEARNRLFYYSKGTRDVLTKLSGV